MVDLQFEYLEGQGRPGFPALLADYQRLSDEVAADTRARLDVPYGPHERQRFDHFPAMSPALGVLLYYHAGYWQSRDKSLFRFLAPYFQQRGFHVVLVNYPLCPQVSLAELVASVRPSVPAVWHYLHGQGITGLPLAVSGHSAGGHLAVELALTHTDGPAAVQGVWGISGVYNPEPLVQTTLNQKLGLDDKTAQAANVIRRVQPGRVPGLWMVGGSETDAFLQQNAHMHSAWQAAGNASTCLVVPDADHFTVLQACIRPNSWFENAFQVWWAQVVAQAPTRTA
jgi:arylformamidase